MATKQETALAVKSKVEQRIDVSKPLLERMGITVEQFQRVTLDALVRNPKIAECTPQSLDLAVITAIESGLLPDGKQAAIVPFNSREGMIATLIPMIEGRIMLARHATPGISFRVKAVFRDDEFEYEEGLHAKLKHTVNPTGSRTDQELIATYAIAKLPGAIDPEFEVFYKADIDRARGYSRARGSSPWDTHFIEMAKNAPFKMLLKRLPKAVTAPPEPPAQLDNYEFTDEVEVVDPYANESQEDRDRRAAYMSAPGHATFDVDADTGEVLNVTAPAPEKPKPKPRTTPRPTPNMAEAFGTDEQPPVQEVPDDTFSNGTQPEENPDLEDSPF